MFHGDHVYPETQFVDGFSHSWSKGKFFAFPPFNLILRCLQKIEMDKYPTLVSKADVSVNQHAQTVTCNNRDTVLAKQA